MEESVLEVGKDPQDNTDDGAEDSEVPNCGFSFIGGRCRVECLQTFTHNQGHARHCATCKYTSNNSQSTNNFLLISCIFKDLRQFYLFGFCITFDLSRPKMSHKLHLAHRCKLMCFVLISIVLALVKNHTSSSRVQDFNLFLFFLFATRHSLS